MMSLLNGPRPTSGLTCWCQDMNVKSTAQEVCRRLREHYGETITTRRLEPVAELVLTILSQNTTDVLARRAYDRLRARYPDWEDVADADEAQLATTISSGGLSAVKAKRIRRALREIRERTGGLELEHLREMPLQEARRWLMSLHGVGPKTAAIVLLFSFGRPALPVDTHVWRVTRRLGLIPEGTSRERAHTLLESILDERCIYHLNHNLVRHGRSTCRARSPHCSSCFLNDLCVYGAGRAPESDGS